MTNITDTEIIEERYAFYLEDCKALGVAPLPINEWDEAQNWIRENADAARGNK